MVTNYFTKLISRLEDMADWRDELRARIMIEWGAQNQGRGSMERFQCLREDVAEFERQAERLIRVMENHRGKAQDGTTLQLRQAETDTQTMGTISPGVREHQPPA